MNEPLLESLYDQLNKDPHKVLYVSVILQAFLDLFKEKRSYEASSITLERDQAKAWFFASVGVTAEDFTEVCDSAGVNPEYMRQFAFRVLKSGEVDFVRKRINAILGH